MHITLLIFHSLVRWLVLVSLVYTLFRAGRGYINRLSFQSLDNTARHWTATIAHIQLLLGFMLYVTSPLIRAFRNQGWHAGGQLSFFGIVHISIMFTAVVLITIGSAVAKRQTADLAKFKSLLIWFSLGLVFIFIAVPWPFSPLANRPYFRLF